MEALTRALPPSLTTLELAGICHVSGVREFVVFSDGSECAQTVSHSALVPTQMSRLFTLQGIESAQLVLACS